MLPGRGKKERMSQEKTSCFQIIKSTGCAGVSEQLKYCVLWGLLSLPSHSDLHRYKMIVE